VLHFYSDLGDGKENKFFFNRKPQDLAGTLHGDLEAKDIIANNDAYFNSIAPIDLQKLKEEIGALENWKNVDLSLKDRLVRQIYNNVDTRLDALSPELKEANDAYSYLKDFRNKEGLNAVLYPADNISSAVQKLSNFENSYTKGNIAKNVKELEELFKKEGQQPFMEDLRDIAAAKDLNNIRTTGDSIQGNIARAAIRPILRTSQFFNEIPLPKPARKTLRKLPKKIQRASAPLSMGTAEDINNLLYGGVNNYEDEINPASIYYGN